MVERGRGGFFVCSYLFIITNIWFFLHVLLFYFFLYTSRKWKKTSKFLVNSPWKKTSRPANQSKNYLMINPANRCYWIQVNTYLSPHPFNQSQPTNPDSCWIHSIGFDFQPAWIKSWVALKGLFCEKLIWTDGFPIASCSSLDIYMLFILPKNEL